MTSLLALFFAASILVAMGNVIPASQLTARDFERQGQQAREEHLQPQSLHMQLADRLLKRVLDLTYETLQDIGASQNDLDNVRRKRNYIQSCYFHAISCY